LRGNWQDFNLHDASRSPSAIAELLVYWQDALPNQQRQSTEGTCQQHLKNIVTTPCENRNSCFPKMWIVFVTWQQKKTAKSGNHLC